MFQVLNYEPFSGRILERIAPRVFALDYHGTRVRFELEPDGAGGRNLTLRATEVDDSIR